MKPSGIKISPIGFLCIGLVVVGTWYYISTLTYEKKYVDMNALLISSIDFAERGGQQVKLVHDSKMLEQKSKGETLEGVDDPLTLGDLNSHRAIMQSFVKYYPDLKVVSEEKDSGTIEGENKAPPLYNNEVTNLVSNPDESIDINDITVWVDPLDATKEFTEDLLEYVTTMVCVAVKGVPVMGIIHKPFENPPKTYWSWVGHGTNIKDSSDPTNKNNVIISLSHAGDFEKKAGDAFDEIKVIKAGGAGYKSLSLFEGKSSVYVHITRIKKWDICAGSAILRHVGGRMTTLKGEEIDYSAKGSPLNEGGLVAAIHSHSYYLEKLSKIF